MVQYSIDFSIDNGPKLPLLWVQVFAFGTRPSHLQAKFVGEHQDDEDDDGWEDMDENENEVVIQQQQQEQQQSKRVKTDETDKSSAVEQQQTDDDECDKFDAGVDADVLKSFLDTSGLGSIQEDKAFFLLMSFPFHEQEWDLVGYLLEAVFGYDSDSESHE
jgi:hypothetical protein